nr:disease resistance protein TAO1-like [Quercus suber]
MQQELFLDIACFFNGEYKDGMIDILQSFGFCPDYNIGALVDRSLITIKKHRTLWMHDLLQEMGQEIVRRESFKELGGRSRLWRYEDVLHVLKNNIGKKFVEGIVLKTPAIKKEDLSVEVFSKMTNLRFLKIGYVQPPEDLIRGPIQLPQGLNYLSNELRVIDWYGYPLESLPTSFQPNKLVELRMHCSDIKQLWKGIMILNELKLIDLSDSQNLIEIPDLSGVPNLKQLILQRCTRLYKIHASLGDLKILKKFPEVVGNMSCLSELSLNETAITGLPLSIEHLIGLIKLDLRDCKNLSSLPNGFYSSMSLKHLNLFGCSKLVKLPENLGNIETLEELDVSATAIMGLPLSIEHLIGLIKLDLRDCKNLSSLPNGFYSSMSLKHLNLSGCSKLVKLPENLGNIETLEELDVSATAIMGLPLSIEHLIGLIKLDLRDCKNLSSLSNGCYSSISLKTLNLFGCSKLDELPKNLGKIKGLEKLDLSRTAITGLPSSVVHLKNLKVLSLFGCVGLSSNKLTRFPLMQPRRSPDPTRAKLNRLMLFDQT